MFKHVHLKSASEALKKILMRVTKIKATVVKMALLESKNKTKVNTETHLRLTFFYNLLMTLHIDFYSTVYRCQPIHSSGLERILNGSEP